MARQSRRKRAASPLSQSDGVPQGGMEMRKHYKQMMRTPSPATAMAAAALFLAAGGPAAAVDAADAGVGLVTGKQVKNNSIASSDIKNGSLTAKDFRPGVLRTGAG